MCRQQSWQEEDVSRGVRRPTAYNEAKATEVLVARNAQALVQCKQPAKEDAEAAVQLGVESAPQGQQPCSDSGTAEAAVAAGAQAGGTLQPQQLEPCHQTASQPNMEVDADAGADQPTAGEPASLPAHPPVAAVSPAGSDIVIDLLADDTDDSMATASMEGSGRTGNGGGAALAAAASDTIVISESSALQQSQDESDMSMDEADAAVSPHVAVLPRPAWVPR